MNTFKELFEKETEVFSDEIKFSENDFDKWRVAVGKMGGNYKYDYQKNMTLVYNSNKKHIATYFKKTKILVTNDTSIFDIIL